MNGINVIVTVFVLCPLLLASLFCFLVRNKADDAISKALVKGFGWTSIIASLVLIAAMAYLQSVTK